MLCYVMLEYINISVNLREITASQCSAGSPCPAHCLNLAGFGGARRPRTTLTGGFGLSQMHPTRKNALN